MYEIIITRKAKENYIWIWKYIALDNLFYSYEVLEKIDYSINLLQTFPFIWKKINNIHRQLLEPKYKFKIVYRIDKNNIYIIWIFREQNITY